MPKIMDAPIPGQSLTAAPGAYAHEKPPQFVDEDKALDYVFNVVLDPVKKKKTIVQLMTLIKGGVTVTELTNTFLYGGVMAGKWTIDLAFLMYQEVSWMFASYAKVYGVKYKFKKENPEYGQFLIDYQDYIISPNDDKEEIVVNKIFSGLGI
jgi:hypothetical protein